MPCEATNAVLVTGATGHVGSRTLLHLLQAGHNVRAAVRSEAKISAILSRPDIMAVNPGSRLSFTIVPDITLPGAYDEAVAGVTHIIHIASPLVTGNLVPPEQHEEYFIKPAVRGTLSLLEAANGSGTVRRVIITSSIVAIVPVAVMEGTQPASSTPVRPTDRIPFTPGPYHSEFAAYANSKMAALQHAEAWMATERPPFDVIHLHPSFVLGKNDVATTPAEAMKGTNAMVLAMLLGKRFGPYAGATVHVEDVARVHLQCLSPFVEGNQSYILSQSSAWNDAKEIAKRRCPEAVESRLIVGSGDVGTIPLPVDASLAEATFEFQHAGFEEQVVSMLEQFLELRKKKRLANAAAISGNGWAGSHKEVLPQVRATA